MPHLTARGIAFEYETFGGAGNPPLLLIMGLGAQMTSWDERFCEALAARGFYVIRYDNRDIGLSTKLDHLGVPDVMAVVRREAPPPYTMEDMADDAAALLDGLGFARAHVVGASMGGFIAQELVLRHPDKVLTLTSIMSGVGGGDQAPPTPEAIAILLARPATEREAMIEQSVAGSRVLWGERYFTDERARRRATKAVDRSVSIAGSTRQAAAMMAQRSRREDLRRVRVPALVVHGDADPLVPLENGERTAEAIPGARLLTLPEVGHDIPPQFYEEVADAIAELARAPQAAGSAT